MGVVKKGKRITVPASFQQRAHMQLHINHLGKDKVLLPWEYIQWINFNNIENAIKIAQHIKFQVIQLKDKPILLDMPGKPLETV